MKPGDLVPVYHDHGTREQVSEVVELVRDHDLSDPLCGERWDVITFDGERRVEWVFDPRDYRP